MADTKKNKEEIKEARSGVRELEKSIKDLSSVVSGLTKQFSIIGGSSKDIAKQVGSSVIAAEDLRLNTSTIISLQDKLLNLYNGSSNNLKVQAESVAALGKSASLRAATELKLAELNEQNLNKEFIEKNKLDGLSKEAINNKFIEFTIDSKIKNLQRERLRLQSQSGAEVTAQLDLTKELIEQLKKEKEDLQKSLKTQKTIDEIVKAQSGELKKQEVLKKTAQNLSEKIKESLGEQFGELEHIGHAIKDSMVSPLALVGALLGSALEEFGKIGRDSRDFLNNTKLTVDQTEHLRHYAHDLSLEYRAQGVQMKDVLNATGALVNTYGSLNQVSDKAVEKVTLLGKAFGISADNAAGVIAQLQRSTGVTAETAGNVAALGANFAKAAGVAPDAVMQDIATSSNEIAKYFKGTPKDLFKTAVEARRLGLDLKKVASISQNLLNFESSIEDQMTASVLLGREINLDKARQLAMEGKIQEAAEETLKQVGSLSDFNKLNAVQKEAVAKATGMEVGDLQKSLQAQEAIKNMTSKQRAEYEAGLKALDQGNESAADRLLKEQRNQLTQEKIADAVAKISDIFANVLLPILDPIFTVLSGIANVIGWMGPGIMFVLRGFLLVKGAMLAVQGIIKLISFKRATGELGLMKTMMTRMSSLGSTLWRGLGNITGITSAKKALDGLKASKAADTAITNSNTLAQTKNALANSSIGKIIGRLGSVFRISSAAKKADMLATNLNTGAQAASIGPTAAAGTAAGGAAIGWAALGLSIAAVGLSIAAIIYSISSLATAFKDLDKDQIAGLESVLASLGKGILIFTGIIAGLVFSGVLPAAAGGLYALGAAALMIGAGILLASTGMTLFANAFKELPADDVSNLGIALFSLAAGLGAIAIASIGFVVALPAILTMTGALMLLTPIFGELGTAIAGLSGGFASLMASIKSMPAAELFASAAGFVSLAGALGVFTVASTGILISLPAITLLTGAMDALGPVLKVVGDGVNYIAFGFQKLANAVKQINPETMWSIAAAFGSVALALGALSVAIVTTAAFAPAAVLLAGIMMTLGASALMVGVALGLAANAIESITNSLITMTSSINPSILDAMKAGLFSLAEGIGAVGLAAMGFTLAVPSVTLFSLLMGTLGSNLMFVGAGMVSITSNLNSFITSVNTLLPMIDQIELLTTAFSDLATAIGNVGIASLLAFPAIGALGAITSMVSGVFGSNTESETAVAAEPTATSPDVSELVTKIESLISAINNQPIQLVVNGKVLAEVVGRNTVRSGAVSSK